MANVLLTPSPNYSYFHELYNASWPPSFVEELKSIPGVQFRNEEGKKFWLVPNETINIVEKLWKTYHKSPFYKRSVPPITYKELNSIEGLRPYQYISLVKALENNGLLVAHEQGLGKTVIGIAWLHTILPLSVNKRALIVVPASVRRQWARVLKEWWSDHPALYMVVPTNVPKVSGRPSNAELLFVKNLQQNTSLFPGIYLCSYQMVEQLPEIAFDCILLDEGQYIKNTKTKAAKEINKRRNKDTLAMILTGTPIEDKVVDLFGIFDMIWPERFGKSDFKFKKRYSESFESEYSISGLGFTKKLTDNIELQNELKDRVLALSDRKTCSDPEVRPYLPDLSINIIRETAPVANMSIDAIIDALENGGDDSEQLKASINVKLKMLCDLLEDLESQEIKHIFTLFHIKEHCQRGFNYLVERFSKYGYEIIYLDGDIPINKREKIISDVAEKMKDPDYRVIVTATADCIAVGLDTLKIFTKAIFVELSTKLGITLQALKRFHRIGSPAPVSTWFLVLDSTSDDRVVELLQEKLEDKNLILESSEGDHALNEKFKISTPEDELLKKLRESVNKINPFYQSEYSDYILEDDHE